MFSKPLIDCSPDELLGIDTDHPATENQNLNDNMVLDLHRIKKEGKYQLKQNIHPQWVRMFDENVELNKRRSKNFPNIMLWSMK